MSIVKETHGRTVAKTVIYRILSILLVMGITLAFGASASTAGKVGLVVLIGGTIIYYLHDRIWLWFGWNRDNIGTDSVWRSVAKTILYRILVLILAFATARVFVTDNNSDAAIWTIVQMIATMILYYICERVFNRIQWGKVAPSVVV